MSDDLSAVLAGIRERTEKATPGPWKVRREHGYDIDGDPWSLPSVIGPDGKDILSGYADQPIPDLRFAADARTDVPRLLAAVDAVLERHQSRQLYEWAEDVHGNPRCGHDEIGDGDRHFEGDDGIWYCMDKPTVKVCRSCSDEANPDVWAAWPCATYSAVLTALTGKDKADG